MRSKKHRKWPIILILILAVVAVGFIVGSSFVHKASFEDALEEKVTSDIIRGEDVPAHIEYSNAVYESISFNVRTNDYKSGMAEVEFTYVDVLALADGSEAEIESQESFYTYCVEQINSGVAPTNTEVIQVSYAILEEDGGKRYVIEDTPELANVLTGGAFSVFQSMLEGG